MPRSKKIVWEGQEYTQSELARKHGIRLETLRYRLEAGVSLEDALKTPPVWSLNIEWQGQLYSAAKLAKKYGMSGPVLRYRLNNGMSLEEALTKKVDQIGRQATINLTSSNGETHTIKEWAKKLGMSQQTLRTRLSKGWEIDRILGPRERSRPRSKGE